MQKNHTVRRQTVGRNFSTGKHKCVVTAVMKHRDSGFTCAQWHLKTVSLHLGDRASGWSWTCNVASDDCEPLVFPGSTSGVPGWQLSTTMPHGEELWTELGHAGQVLHSGTVGLHVRCATVFTRLYFLSEYCTWNTTNQPEGILRMFCHAFAHGCWGSELRPSHLHKYFGH